MYTPSPIDTSKIIISGDVMALGELLAKNTHEVWAAGRMAEGWTYGAERNDALKQHPGLVPYEELSESEKDYDRATSLETLKAILSFGYKIKKAGGK